MSVFRDGSPWLPSSDVFFCLSCQESVVLICSSRKLNCLVNDLAQSPEVKNEREKETGSLEAVVGDTWDHGPPAQHALALAAVVKLQNWPCSSCFDGSRLGDRSLEPCCGVVRVYKTQALGMSPCYLLRKLFMAERSVSSAE